MESPRSHPPIRPGASGHDADRSPYNASLDAFVDAMGTTHSRLNIIDGLLSFRSEIHKIGLEVGFQWIDGSFSENVESTEGRDPRDVDVVTFFELAEGETEDSIFQKNPNLFDHDFVKQTYLVDSYWSVLGVPIDYQSVKQISYWYSMWSHRRDGLWKGFVQVGLESPQDLLAKQALAQAKIDLGVAP
jgi:hypothetical protein